MKKLATIMMALGLVLGACKKEEKDGGGDKAAKKADKDVKKGDEKKGDDKKADQPKADDSKVEPKGDEPTGDQMKEDQAAADPAKADPGAGAATGDGWKLTLKAPAVGLKITQETKGSTNIKFDAGGGKTVPLDVETTKVVHSEVLEVGGDVVTKMKVHYADHSAKQTMMGKSETEEKPTHGKAYLLTDKGGKLDATHEDGSAVTAEEMEDLEEDFGDQVGRTPGEARVVASRAWTKGERYELTADDLKIMAEGKPAKEKLIKVAMTFLGETDGVAEFDMEATMEMKDMKAELNAEVKGHIKLDVANARPIEMTTGGEITGKVMGPKGSMPVTGTGGDTKTYSYQ